ncbi:EAL domain-containing protein, partial [bacterium]
MTELLRAMMLEYLATDAELSERALSKDGIQFTAMRVETRADFANGLRDFMPGLILSDYALPSFDGLAALQIAKDVAPDIPFIFVSGTLGEERAIETMKMGATDYVLKQRLSRLAPVVRRALQETKERIAGKQLEAERNKLWAAVETGGDWTLITDRHGKIEYVNHAVEQISGYHKKEMLGKNPRLFKSQMHDDDFYRHMWDILRSGKAFRSIFINRKKEGALFYLDLTITPLGKEGAITNFVATGKDITEKRLMEERLNYLAYTDVLTGLANRSLFFDRLGQVMATAAQDKKLAVAAIIDLDRFKYVNETFGAGAGDEILQEVAKRLTGSVRPGDTVARYGGDDFGIILTEIEEMKDAILIIEKMINALSSPYRSGDEELISTFSIGISVCPADSTDPQKLMQFADVALAKAKEQKGNSYRFYAPGMNIVAANFLSMERDLFRALDMEEFVVHFQPYFQAKTGKLAGMEGLIRWDKKGTLIFPEEFVPILEETGLIIDVGEWVIKTACQQIARWRTKGYDLVPVSVNLSPTQFRQENLTARIVKYLAASEVEAQLLTFEITETIFISNLEHTKQLLQQFSNLGLRLSIDDFGTGYSSLKYIARLPLNNLKIDISFIRNIVTDPKAFSIVKVIIAMAHELGLETIAEGVECAEQLAILDQLG